MNESRVVVRVSAYGECRAMLEAAAHAAPNAALAEFDVVELVEELASRADYIDHVRYRDDSGDSLCFGMKMG